MAAVQKRQIWGVIYLMLLILYFSVLPAQAQYGGGSGTAEDPYLIYTTEQMNAIGAEPNDWDKHFKLMADIDLSIYTGTDFNIIGIDWNNAFTGVFDGNGHTISNFSYTSTDKRYIGLFGCVGAWKKDAMIKGLELIDPNVDAGTGNYVGSLVGELKQGTVTNCSVKGGTVSGNREVGGLVGENFEGEITNCYVTGNVEGVNSVGGLVGTNSSTLLGKRAEITNCYSVGSVTGNRNVGGLVGINGGWTFIIGGSIMTDNYSTGSVEAGSGVDDLAGNNGHFKTGYICSPSTISNCYSIGSVVGDNLVGGLLGNNECGEITNCYSSTAISGDEPVGGLVGYGDTDWVINCFWDIQASCQCTSAGGIGLMLAEMQTESTFIDAGWDFVDETENGTEDIWWILEGQSYPRLWWQYGLTFSPYPQDGAIDVIRPVILNWLPGGSDLNHDVYFSEDEEAVANAMPEISTAYRGRLPVEVTTFDPGKLALDTTYYWRIDGVGEADPNSPWIGNVWSFTAANFIVVDDFESYNDLDPHDPNSNRIYLAWIDLDYPRINGAIVGYVWPGEYMIVHSGVQSMPFYYDNSGPANYSEATMTLTDQRDWTIEGVGILSLWFYGNADNTPETMYVVLNGIARVDNDNHDAIQEARWTEWRIDLTRFADQGVNLANVNSITIGFGDKNNPQFSGSGKVFFDDIRLYQPDPQEPEP